MRVAVSHATSMDHLLQDVRKEVALLAPGISSIAAHHERSPSPSPLPQSTLLVISPQDGDEKFLAGYREFVNCIPTCSHTHIHSLTHSLTHKRCCTIRVISQLKRHAVTGARVVGCSGCDRRSWSPRYQPSQRYAC